MADKTAKFPTAEAFEEKVKALEQAEAELARVRERLEGVTEMARLAYWEHDIINDIYTFNNQFYKIFHTTAEAVGGYQMTSEQYVHQFMHPDDIPALLSEVKKTRESGYSRPDRQIEHRIVFPDGSTGYVAVTFFLVTNSDGKPARAHGVTQDITERKRAERERQAHLRFFECMDSINRAGEQMMGLPREKLIGKSYHELTTGPEAAEHTKKEQSVIKGGRLVDIPEETVKMPTG